MASILEYALSLKTAGFNNPLADSESKLKKFDTSTLKGASSLEGMAAAASGAGIAVGAFAAATGAALAVLNSYAEFDGLVRGLKTLEGTAEATQERITLLRDVAKVPGLGFEEAVKGDIRLRAVGISANLSEKAMRAFGNAIATVGGGKADLDGVNLALSQMAAKGKVSAEEINQIAERVPQVRAALKDAFGTADSEALQQSGIGAMEVIEGLVDELAKLPQVTGGGRNELDNFDDSWKALKNSASEFAVGISGSWVSSVSGAFNQASRDLQRLKDLFGVETPGLQGPDGETDAQREAEKAAEAQAEAARTARNAENRVANENEDFWRRKAEEREANLKELEEERLKNVKRNLEAIRALGEQHAKAVLSEEEFLRQKIAQLEQGATRKEDLSKFSDGSDAQRAAAKNITELAEARKRLAELNARDAAAAEAKQKAADQLAESNARERLALATKENEISTAPPRGLLDEAASQARRVSRAGDSGDRVLGNTDRLALAAYERRQNRPLNPSDAAAQLARGNSAADPGRTRREERAEAKQTPDQNLLKTVKEIAEKFSNLATA